MLAKQNAELQQRREESELLVKKLTTPEELDKLKEKTEKWTSITQEAIQLLQGTQEGVTREQIIKFFNLTPSRDVETDSFY